jgi:hypothetical protein
VSRHITTDKQSKETPMTLITRKYKRNDPRLRSNRFSAALQFTKSRFIRMGRTLAPALIALSFATIAHAQGTMDFSGAQTLMGTFKTFAMYAGAVICLAGLIFAGIRMMTGRFQDAIPGLFGALFGAGVLGWGAGWIGSLTGQSM